MLQVVADPLRQILAQGCWALRGVAHLAVWAAATAEVALMAATAATAATVVVTVAALLVA